MKTDLESKYMPVTESGCWIWLGYSLPRGYGRVFHEGKMWMAHRLTWTLAHGEIPDGHFVCHKCDTPACINPDHLFTGTHTDNMRDMLSKRRNFYQKRTHCIHGHEFTPENTLLNRHGRRGCIECHRRLDKQRKRVKRAKQRAERELTALIPKGADHGQR